MPKVKEIPFSSLPRQSALFLDYLALAPKVLHFFQHPPTVKSLERLLKHTHPLSMAHRSAMASILRKQNAVCGADAKTQQYINDLELPDCVAVVTGQQVGFLTGPLYTIYKALTAVRIAEKLQSLGVKAIPVFWMETEDHDLAEVTRMTLLKNDASIETLNYQEAFFGEAFEPTRSVGAIKFPENVRQAVKNYFADLAESEWKAEMLAQAESAYRPGSTFALAFAQLLTLLVRKHGLILFNPSDAEAKRLASPLYRKALQEADSIRTALVERNHALESAGYHAQVRVLENSTVLFFYEGEERQSLEKFGSEFRLKNGTRSFTLENLIRIAERDPEKFSPNVLLRPLVQDFLFPTVVYVGGSAEIAYFAQIQSLYELLGHPMPVIWPRTSITLIEPEIRDLMGRLEIEMQDLFQTRQLVMEKALSTSGLPRAVAVIQGLIEQLDRTLAGIRPEMQAAEATLVQALDTAKHKMLHNMEGLKSRFISIEADRNASVGKAVNSLLHNCVPHGNLQEREFGIFNFLSRHGLILLDAIYAAGEIGKFCHYELHLSDLHD